MTLKLKKSKIQDLVYKPLSQVFQLLAPVVVCLQLQVGLHVTLLKLNEMKFSQNVSANIIFTNIISTH